MYVYVHIWLYEPVDKLEFRNEREERSVTFLFLSLALFICISFPANNVISHFSLDL